MKKLIMLLFVVIGFNTNAQQRRILKNQAKTIELNQSREVIRRKNAKIKYGVQSQVVQQRRGGKRRSQVPVQRRRTINFDYCDNYSNSQINVQIPEYGYFGVEIEGQYIDTYTGKYRFFDVKEGMNWVSVYKDGYLIYKTPLKIYLNTRVVLEFDSVRGLSLLSERPLQVETPIYIAPPSYVDVDDRNRMRNSEFTRFKSYVANNCSFDDEKIEYIQLAKKRSFTTQQIRELLNLMSWGSKKMTVVKLTYSNCIDRDRYYTLLDCFTFSSEKRKLRKFIDSQQN